jgi:hypothetical protein
MKNRIIVWGLALICIFLIYQFPDKMISPGNLANGHKNLDNKCLSCHQPFWGISNDKCISCHKLDEISKSTDSNSIKIKLSFHNFLKNQDCCLCHAEHKGTDPNKTNSFFNHESLSDTITKNCINCHKKPSDFMHKQISDDCSICHSTNNWKNSTKFNHNQINKDVLNNCSNCHKKPKDDFHISLVYDCSKCHSTNKWVPSTFDHNSTFFLDNDHKVKCNTCHINNIFGKYTCYGCHEHSEIKIKAIHNGEGIYRLNDCISCHKNGENNENEFDDESDEKSNRDDD